MRDIAEPGDDWTPGRGLTDEMVHDSMYGRLRLRDLFAAFALAGIIANPDSMSANVAETAYAYADAMLTQRNKHNHPTLSN